MVALEKEKEGGELKGKKDEIIPTKKKELELTLNTNFVVGLDSPKTMKFVGDIKGKTNGNLTRQWYNSQFYLSKASGEIGSMQRMFSYLN